jgi:RNA-directed DNA polymerase
MLTTPETIRTLQRKLYRKAKQEPACRFHALYDKVYRADILKFAYRLVRANKGSAGIDGVTFEAIEENEGAPAFIGELEEALRNKTYKPDPVKRVMIPKSDGSQRPLGIPTIRDRVAQMATKLVIEPIFEADFLECSWGFRPKRSTYQALERIRGGIRRGNCWVVDADIRSFFDEIPRGKLVEALRERVSDRRVIELIQSWLRAGVLVGGSVLHPEAGTPQGGVASPLLANVYLHQFDRAWEERYRQLGELTRYCDDLVIVCRTKADAEAALQVLERLLAELGLQVAEAKTRLVDVEGGEGFDFLGFHHRKVRSVRNPSVMFLASWPGHAAMQRARARVRETLARRQLLRPVADVITDVNRFLRGWGGYFRHGNSTRHFNRLDRYVTRRAARFISMKCDHPGFGYGLRVLAGSGNDLGLYRLVGTVGRVAVQTVR